MLLEKEFFAERGRFSMNIAVCDDQLGELAAVESLLRTWQEQQRAIIRLRLFHNAGELLEAARIDGAREWRVFLQILMPACKSSWVTVVLFCVQAYWGMDTGYFVYKEEMKGIKAGFNAITTVSQLRYGVQSASGVVLLLVPLITFIITQSNVMDSLATSGMKD